MPARRAMLTDSGYNFTSEEHITPFLEPTCAGPSTVWAKQAAQKYQCYVTVGYPEKTMASSTRLVAASAPVDDSYATHETPDRKTHNFNSTVTVSPFGHVLANYRKRFLYYTDALWASEGDNKDTKSGFYAGQLDGVSVAMGICMDINPYQFTSAPWNKYEFANHVIDVGAQLVILSMAWLTLLTPLELEKLSLHPDQDTFTYWMERFYPLQGNQGSPVFLVLANRCGVEGQACYAGSSAVVSFRDGKTCVYDMLGRCEEKCMVVDLEQVFLASPYADLATCPHADLESSVSKI